MKNLFKVSGLVGVLLLVLTGCGGAKIYNVQNSPVELEHNVKADENSIYKAIKRAGYKRGWRVTKLKPGKAKAFINVRGKHQATAIIDYNMKEYSITYKSSKGLKYSEGSYTIHKNYNKWVNTLDSDIQFELGTLQGYDIKRKNVQIGFGTVTVN